MKILNDDLKVRKEKEHSKKNAPFLVKKVLRKFAIVSLLLHKRLKVVSGSQVNIPLGSRSLI